MTTLKNKVAVATFLMSQESLSDSSKVWIVSVLTEVKRTLSETKPVN